MIKDACLELEMNSLILDGVWTRVRGTAYFRSVFNTFLLSAKVVLPHSAWACCALATARSMPSGVAGFTRPRDWPVAGA